MRDQDQIDTRAIYYTIGVLNFHIKDKPHLDRIYRLVYDNREFFDGSDSCIEVAADTLERLVAESKFEPAKSYDAADMLKKAISESKLDRNGSYVVSRAGGKWFVVYGPTDRAVDGLFNSASGAIVLCDWLNQDERLNR